MRMIKDIKYLLLLQVLKLAIGSLDGELRILVCQPGGLAWAQLKGYNPPLDIKRRSVARLTSLSACYSHFFDAVDFASFVTALFNLRKVFSSPMFSFRRVKLNVWELIINLFKLQVYSLSYYHKCSQTLKCKAALAITSFQSFLIKSDVRGRSIRQGLLTSSPRLLNLGV